jgi:uncharacterized protein YpiB (UPF0302 family)
MRKTLLEQVTGWMTHQQHKHGLCDDYAEQTVNQMSNYELLVAISEALEKMQSTGKEA